MSSDPPIAPERLLELIDTQAAPVIVDVRSRREFRAGHVPGAVNIPFWTIVSAPIPAKVEDPLVVYCGHGPRAWFARAVLRWNGFKRVALLEGHMSRWRREGLRQER